MCLFFGLAKDFKSARFEKPRTRDDDASRTGRRNIRPHFTGSIARARTECIKIECGPERRNEYLKVAKKVKVEATKSIDLRV